MGAGHVAHKCSDHPHAALAAVVRFLHTACGALESWRDTLLQNNATAWPISPPSPSSTSKLQSVGPPKEAQNLMDLPFGLQTASRSRPTPRPPVSKHHYPGPTLDPMLLCLLLSLLQVLTVRFYTMVGEVEKAQEAGSTPSADGTFGPHIGDRRHEATRHRVASDSLHGNCKTLYESRHVSTTNVYCFLKLQLEFGVTTFQKTWPQDIERLYMLFLCTSHRLLRTIITYKGAGANHPKPAWKQPPESRHLSNGVCHPLHFVQFLRYFRYSAPWMALIVQR